MAETNAVSSATSGTIIQPNGTYKGIPVRILEEYRRVRNNPSSRQDFNKCDALRKGYPGIENIYVDYVNRNRESFFNNEKLQTFLSQNNNKNNNENNNEKINPSGLDIWL